jgi:hypothetical protein
MAQTAAEIFKAEAPAPSHEVHDFPNSYEALLRAIKGPACEGSGCSNKPTYTEAGDVDYKLTEGEIPHYLDVVATFPDHAFVRCSSENKVWKVPYDVDDSGTISTGTPEEQVAVFKPLDEAGEDDDVAEGGGASL